MLLISGSNSKIFNRDLATSWQRAASYRQGMVASRSTAWRTALAPRGQARRRDQAVRLPSAVWVSLLGDPETVAAYYRHVCRRAPGLDWPWLGPISDSGSAKLRASRAMGSRVIAAPVLGYQLSRGLLRPGPDGRLPVIRHACDESACTNPAHWVLGTRADNSADYEARKDDPLSPLADLRGPAGRARAIRRAVLEAQARGASPEGIDHAIRRVMDAGMPGVQDALFYTGQAAKNLETPSHAWAYSQRLGVERC